MSTGKYRKENNCLNCGFHVEKHYCSSCGQPNLELDENFWQFISHSIAHYFHFDNKFFQTLVPLLSKPGKVTLDYLAGKRARYINPVSMYIFVSILYFLVVYSPNFEKGAKKDTTTVNFKKPDLAKVTKPLTNSGLVDEEIIAKGQEDIDESFDREAFRELPFKQQTIVLNKLKAKYKDQKNDSTKGFLNSLVRIHNVANDSTYSAYLSRQAKLPTFEKDNFFERYTQKRSIEIGQNREVINEQLEHNRPKVYFLFMPLMAFFIMLNFRKNKIKYLDHLIFTIHGMTAFFLVGIIVQPTKRFLFGNASTLSGIIEAAMVVWICWYLFKSLKIFYQRKTSTTIWRMMWVIALYAISYKLAEMVVMNVIYYVAT